MVRPRRLTESEIEIWLKVVRTVQARPGAKTPVAAPPKPASSPPQSPSPPPPKFTPAPNRAPTAASYTPPVSNPAGVPLAPFERRYRKKVAAGRIDIDDALDLHGLTQAEAHGALVGFLLRAQAHGARLVLVVTGKGGPNRRPVEHGGEIGVLRRAVPHWLRDKVLRAIVIGFEEAAQGHGGAGALYIRLRRRSAAD